MRILNRLGGIELSQAYACIKAISKKKPEIIAQRQGRVPRRARQSAGSAEETAAKIFDLIVFFGGYGFNKSHSHGLRPGRLPDGLPEGALPARVHGGPALHRDRRRQRARQSGRAHRRLPPDGDRGPAARHQPRVESSSRSPRRARSSSAWRRSRGSATRRSRRSCAAREAGGPFASLYDFFERVPPATVSQACVETLIKAGAFDGLGARRSQLLAVLPRAVQAGQAQPERPQARPAQPLRRLRASNGSARARRRAPEPARRPRAARRRAPGRGEEGPRLLHVEPPADPPRGPACRPWPPTRSPTSAGSPEKAEVILGGMIAGVQVKNVQKSRSGLTRMAKLTFEDLTGSRPGDALARGVRQARRPRQERPDRLRQGDARPPPRPRRADHHQDHPPRPRARRALARGRRPAPQGGPPGVRPRAPAPPGPGPSGQPRPLPGDPRPDPGPSAPSTRPAPR